MHGTVIGTVISKGVLPTRKGLRIFQAVLRDETGMIEVSWPGQPFLDRTIDKGDVLLRDRHRALLPRPPAAAARVRQPRRRRARDRAGTRAVGLSGHGRAVVQGDPRRSSTLISTRCLPLGHRVSAAGACSTAAGSRASATRCAWCTGRRRSPRRCAGRSRLAFEELFFVHLLHQRAKELAREHRARHSLREQAASSRRAARSAAVPAHRGAGARDPRDRRRHVQRPPHAAAAPGRRRQRQDDRRAVRRAARDRERAIRPRSWCRPSCSPNSMCARSAGCSRRSASSRCC